MPEYTVAIIDHFEYTIDASDEITAYFRAHELYRAQVRVPNKQETEVVSTSTMLKVEGERGS